MQQQARALWMVRTVESVAENRMARSSVVHTKLIGAGSASASDSELVSPVDVAGQAPPPRATRHLSKTPVQ
jgi:hypothetical protein